MNLKENHSTIHNQRGAGKLDTVLKIMMISFISLLAFSSGVWFGKKLSDSDYQLKIVEGDSATKAESTTASHAAKSANDMDEAITEDEVTELADKAVHGEKAAATETAAAKIDTKAGGKGDSKSESKTDAKSVAKSDSKTDAKTAAVNARQIASAPSSKPDLSAAHKAANHLAANEPITALGNSNTKKTETVASRVPNALPKTVGSLSDVEFTVQVASYPTADAAKVHADELVKQGFPAFPVEAKIGAKVWYRVSVGSFKTLKEATGFRNQLVKQTEVATAIVQKIQR
jgi:cell division protein FtsN